MERKGEKGGENDICYSITVSLLATAAATQLVNSAGNWTCMLFRRLVSTDMKDNKWMLEVIVGEAPSLTVGRTPGQRSLRAVVCKVQAMAGIKDIQPKEEARLLGNHVKKLRRYAKRFPQGAADMVLG